MPGNPPGGGNWKFGGTPPCGGGKGRPPGAPGGGGGKGRPPGPAALPGGGMGSGGVLLAPGPPPTAAALRGGGKGGMEKLLEPERGGAGGGSIGVSWWSFPDGLLWVRRGGGVGGQQKGRTRNWHSLGESARTRRRAASRGTWRATSTAGRGTWHAGEAGRGHASWEGERRHAGGRGECAEAAEAAEAAGLILGQHGVVVGLALGGVGGGDGVDDGLGLLVADLLVVIDDVAQVVAARVVRLAHAHRVVREVDIAVVAEDCGSRARDACAGVSMWFGRSRMKVAWEDRAYTLAS